MARCKDCVHYEACSAFSKIINSAREVEKGCEYFKDRTKYAEVVRCKDCKHCMMCYPEKQIGKEATQGWYCKEFKGWRRPDAFCSYGERRNEG